LSIPSGQLEREFPRQKTKKEKKKWKFETELASQQETIIPFGKNKQTVVLNSLKTLSGMCCVATMTTQLIDWGDDKY
jgi:hypothetical protein